MNEELIELYQRAKTYLVKMKWDHEIKWVDEQRFEQQTEDSFVSQYVWTILSTNMRNQVAQKMYDNFMTSDAPLSTVKHDGKRKAIMQLSEHCKEWFETLKKADDKLGFLGTLPYLGKINRYLIARNLGLDVAKPDRHMVRLAQRFGFSDVQQMCQAIRDATGDRIGTIDVILWRASNLGVIEKL